MPNMTADDCWKKYRSLTNGITRDRDELKAKLDALFAAWEQYGVVMAKVAKAGDMTDDELMELSTEAAKLKEQLVAAAAVVNERASARNPAAKLTMQPVWLRDDLADMAEKLTAIMSDVKKLIKAERDEFDRKARAEGYVLDAIAADEKQATADLKDIWKQYKKETEALLKDWTEQANIYVRLERRPETSFAGKAAKVDKAITQLTAILTAREKSRQKPPPPPPSVPKPKAIRLPLRIMYHMR